MITSEIAYLYGLFLADGHLPHHGKASYSTKDKQLAELIVNLLPETRLKVEEVHKHPFYRLYISNNIADIFYKLGCPRGRKSHILNWPTDIPPQYTRDFVRGFFDGDGATQNNKYLIVFASSSINFLKILERIGVALGCFSQNIIPCSTGSCYRLMYSDMIYDRSSKMDNVYVSLPNNRYLFIEKA